MKIQKHPIIYCIVALLSLFLYTSCENKRDDSGTLGGMWQLVEWRIADGSIVYQKPDTTIYYKIRNNLLMLQELPGETDTYFLTYYHLEDDYLVINQPYTIVRDSELDTIPYTIDALRKYGIPGNGRLHIDVMASDKMVLTGEEGTLRFRKY
ncbi:MAG: lipocalin-like domain-containing protein [Bacteroidaceae bacterium]|nr:lipocalin-like domain-containing protein [Bacteroidaceae bacterium]